MTTRAWRAFNKPADRFKALQDQTTKLFGGIHYDHMLWLSGDFGQVYYEHN